MSTPPAAAPRRDLAGRLGLLLVVVAAVAVFTALEIGRRDLWCIDGYYHIKCAQLIRTHVISRSFPWWQETFLRGRWADKDFLYHILLIPFTFGNLVVGAKAAAVVFATGAVATFHEAARRLRVPWATAFTLALMAFSPMLLARLAFPRSFVLALILALAGTVAILRGRPRAAAAFAAVYPWAHISYHLLPCIALVHDLHRPRDASGRRSFEVTAWTLGGTVAGVVLNPFFPNNLRLWWVQIVHVLGGAWGLRVPLRLGEELLPPAAEVFLSLNLGMFLALLAALWLLARGTRPSPEGATLLLVASGFLALSFRSVLFLEFAFPYVMLFAGVVVRDRLETPQLAPSSAWLRRAAAVVVVASLALGARTADTMRKLAPSRRLPDFSGASEYMRRNVPAGETLFHLDWDDFPQLFYRNSELRFLVGLDPTFMVATDPARWRLYDDVANGRVADAFAPILRDFRCRWAFATSDDLDFLVVARRDPRFVERFRDLAASVFELMDDGDAIGSWRVTGYWADPARRLFEVPLDGQGDGGASSPMGRAENGVQVSTGGGFLDLERAVALPDHIGEACAVAEADVEASSESRSRLGIASDDEMRVSVNGQVVFAHSPLRTPRPGLPGGPPLSLDALDTVRPDTAEREIDVSLRPGANRMVVQACRAGEDFGFFIRLK